MTIQQYQRDFINQSPPIVTCKGQRQWPDGTPRHKRAGEPFRTQLQRDAAYALDKQLCKEQHGHNRI